MACGCGFRVGPLGMTQSLEPLRMQPRGKRTHSALGFWGGKPTPDVLTPRGRDCAAQPWYKQEGHEKGRTKECSRCYPRTYVAI